MRTGKKRRWLAAATGAVSAGFSIASICLPGCSGGERREPLSIPPVYVAESYVCLDLEHALVLEAGAGDRHVFFFRSIDSRHEASYELWHVPPGATPRTAEVTRGGFYIPRTPFSAGRLCDTVANADFSLSWGPPATLFIDSGSVRRHAVLPLDSLTVSLGPPDIQWTTTYQGDGIRIQDGGGAADTSGAEPPRGVAE